MRAKLEERGNKYDILDFVFHRTSQLIGLKPLDPRVSALKIDREGEDDLSEGDDDLDDLEIEECDENDRKNLLAVHELPRKVDMFSQYVNDMYFDGDIDATSEDYLKKSMAEGNVDQCSEGKEKPRKKKAYCSD